MIIGYRLRSLRKENKMSQAELGKLLGVTKVSVSGYENGTRVPSIEIFIMILNVFNVSADYILGRELSAVYENDDDNNFVISKDDAEIIKILRKKPSVYNLIMKNPKRFFATIDKNNI